MSFRLATFNVLDLFEHDPEPPGFTDAKLAFIARELTRADADIVALQEVGSEALVDRLIKREAASLGYQSVAFGPADRRGIRNAILSRLPAVHTQVHNAASLRFPRFVDGDPEPFGDRIPLRRGLLHVRIATPGGPVDVMVVHFKSKLGRMMQDADGQDLVDVSARGFAEAQLRSLVLRSAEALFVRGVVDDLLAPGSAQIAIAGDFNDTLDSIPVQIVSGMGRGLDPALVLRPAASLVADDRRFSARHSPGPALIDHVLTSATLADRLVGCEIFNESLRDHGPHDPTAPPATDSDHALVVCTFS